MNGHLRTVLEARYEQCLRLEEELARLRSGKAAPPTDGVAAIGKWRRNGAAG